MSGEMRRLIRSKSRSGLLPIESRVKGNWLPDVIKQEFRACHTHPNLEHIIDKYGIYNDIEQRIKNCNTWTKTREGGLIVGIICQRIKDAMGILRADKVRVYIRVDDVSSRYSKARQMTHQQVAIEWFRNKEHFPWCDLVDITPTWINWLLKTKAGVKL